MFPLLRNPTKLLRARITSVKLIVGLGNPGEKYKNNRHNVGFMVVDRLVTSNKAEVTRGSDLKLVTCYLLPSTRIILARPTTYMNESGKAVKKLVAHYKIKTPDLWVIHDDLDIKLGDYKIQKGRGPRDHKGLLSIYDSLGTKDFWHVRVGVDNREKMENHISGEAYVLQDFTKDELEMLEKTINNVVSELLRKLI